MDDDTILRLLFKGKTIAQEAVDNNTDNMSKRTIDAAATGIQKLNSLRSDPLMRGFD